jgi:hypothetical protein
MFEAFSAISIQLGEIFFFFFCVAGGSVLYMQDQYINHIMNETGVTVSLRGCGSGEIESLHGEGTSSLYVI